MIENKSIRCKVIVCGPAIGKTYLAKIDSRFIDLDGEKAMYKYGLFQKSEKEFENGKLNRGAVINYDSTIWAINKLEEYIKKNRIVLISFSDKLLKYLLDNKIDYCLVYANKDSRLEYIDRMKKRGNTDFFIDQMTNEIEWKRFYNQNISDTNPKYKIELKKGEYLSDIKDYFLK